MEQLTPVHRLEDALARLAEAQARTEVAVSHLAEAQARTEERLGRLEEHVQALAEAQVRAAERLERLEVQVQALAAAQVRTEERLERLEAQVQALAAAQMHTEERLERLTLQVEALVQWQRGEVGRRDGERYERDVVRRAAILFNGGYGGSAENPEVQRRLVGLLRTVLAEDILAPEADPSLADLLWWKQGQVAVVEVSLQVNGTDVARAQQRAATLRRAGTQTAQAVVIGEHWATLDSREQARSAGVAWKVGADLSDGFVALRRLTPDDAESPA